MSNEFSHLHVHSDYSLLDGLGKIGDYVKYGKSLGMKAMAFTDHGTMAGLVTAYDTCKANGMKFIGGFEAYVAPYGTTRFEKKASEGKAYNHLIILFKNAEGYKNGCELLTRSHTEGFYYKPRIDFDLLKEHHEGLVVMSACLAGAVPQAIVHGNVDLAKQIIMEYKEVFGDDYYLEIQDHGIPEEREVITALLTLSEECGVKLIATNDCHYVRKDEKEAHNWLLCMQTDKRINEENRMINDGDYYLKSKEEMLDRMAELLKTVVNWGLKTMLGAVVGLQVVRNLVAPVLDTLKRSMVGRAAGALPGIGNAVNMVTELVLTSAVLVRNCLGVVILLAFVAVGVGPVIHYGLQSLVYRFLAAVAQPVSDKRIVESLATMGEGCAMLLKVLFTAEVLCMLDFVILMTSVGGGA